MLSYSRSYYVILGYIMLLCSIIWSVYYIISCYIILYYAILYYMVYYNTWPHNAWASASAHNDTTCGALVVLTSVQCGQFSEVQSGKMGPAPGRFELPKAILKWNKCTGSGISRPSMGNLANWKYDNWPYSHLWLRIIAVLIIMILLLLSGRLPYSSEAHSPETHRNVAKQEGLQPRGDHCSIHRSFYFVRVMTLYSE